MSRPPMLHLAVIGLPQAGKTTLFSILSGFAYEKAVLSPLSAQVRVVDPNLTWLHEHSYPEAKLTYPTLQLYDTPPLAFGEAEGKAEVFAAIRELDGFVVVLKGYELKGSPEEKKKALDRELDEIRSELHMIDLEKVERRIGKLRETVKKPVPEQKALQRELEVLERIFEEVSSGKTGVFESLSEEDEKKLRSFQFFSKRPLIPIANIADTDAGKIDGIPLKLELELAGMSGDERKEFMEMYGLEDLATEGMLNRLVREMGRVIYYTAGDPEVTGWGIASGTRARTAAGEIHTDIEKGFIAAEVLPFDAVHEHGSLQKARVKAKPRTEGKDYVLKDGDILHFKFRP